MTQDSYPKMNPEIKVKWLHDLRTTKVPQVYGKLEKKMYGGEWGNCCLGRLCHVLSVPAMPSVEDEKTRTFNGCSALPSPSIMYTVGILETVDILAHMNDSGKTFKEIADWIETNL